MLWKFLLEEWVPASYQNNWYNDGGNPLFPCIDGSNGACPRIQDDVGILFDNKMLGVPRLRQLRVKNDSCEIHPQFSNTIRKGFKKVKINIRGTVKNKMLICRTLS